MPVSDLWCDNVKCQVNGELDYGKPKITSLEDDIGLGQWLCFDNCPFFHIGIYIALRKSQNKALIIKREAGESERGVCLG